VATVALIDDDSVQLQLYKAQLSKQNIASTIFHNGAEFLAHNAGIPTAPYDAIIIDYHMPGMNAIETIECLDDTFRQSCKICVVSGNTLPKADRSALDGQGIRVLQKNQSTCLKIVELLRSPDVRKCSSCTKWQPLTSFSGKATCDTCRPKKRKQGEWAKKNKRATSNLLQEENERLRLVATTQSADIIALRNQVSKQLATIDRLQSGSNVQQETMTCLAAAGGRPADPQAFRQARLVHGARPPPAHKPNNYK